MPAPDHGVLTLGSLFHGRYRVVRCIRAGGMGAVYEVRDEKTDTPRALKVMLPSVLEDADMRARFGQEARVTGAIESDHIVRVSDAGVDESTEVPFLVMDLLRGEDLREVLRTRGPLPADTMVRHLHQAALALDRTHASSVIHRDLKPENLFVTTRDDGSTSLKILDFGIAKVVKDGDGPQTTRAVGTPVYMAPELLRKKYKIGPGVDIYALGHIAYALLVGEPYWEPESRSADSVFALLFEILQGPKEAPTARAKRRREVDLPAAFDAWFLRVTALDPADRFGSARETVVELAKALDAPLPGTGPIFSGRTTLVIGTPLHAEEHAADTMLEVMGDSPRPLDTAAVATGELPQRPASGPPRWALFGGVVVIAAAITLNQSIPPVFDAGGVFQKGALRIEKHGVDINALLNQIPLAIWNAITPSEVDWSHADIGPWP